MDYNKHSTVFLSQFINKLGINWPFYDPLFPQQSILANLFKGSSNDYVYLQSLKLLHQWFGFGNALFMQLLVTLRLFLGYFARGSMKSVKILNRTLQMRKIT